MYKLKSVLLKGIANLAKPHAAGILIINWPSKMKNVNLIELTLSDRNLVVVPKEIKNYVITLIVNS